MNDPLIPPDSCEPAMQAAERGMTMVHITLPFAKVRDASELVPDCPLLAKLLEETVPAGMGKQCVLDVTLRDADTLVESFGRAAIAARQEVKPSDMLNCGQRIVKAIRER